jgi:hypothetical protein
MTVENIGSGQLNTTTQQVADSGLTDSEQLRGLPPDAPQSNSFAILMMRSARTRRCSALSGGNPRSRNTFPPKGVALGLAFRVT